MKQLLAGILIVCLAACGRSEDTGEQAAEPGGGAVADIVISGGPIYTGVDSAGYAGAVAIAGNRILAVGSDSDVAKVTGPATQHIDLGGAALFPGFVDSHMHIYGIGRREETLNLEGVGSIAELVERVGERVAATEPGAPVIGRGWIETHYPEAHFPTRDDLDPVSPDNPVILTRADGHALVANSAALERAGITAETEIPFGGDILKDADGRPTGMLIDNAQELVSGLAESRTDAQRAATYALGGRVMAQYGWTEGHAMSQAPSDVPMLEELSDSGEFPVRLYISIDGGDRQAAQRLIEQGPRHSAGGRIVTRAIKLYMDGALGSRGAALLEPYSDADTSGLLVTTHDDMMPVLTAALSAGIQVNTHAIGDRGNQLLLDWYEEAFNAVPADERAVPMPRWRDEHSQILAVEDIPRFAELGVIPSMQPSHAIGDLYFAPARLGEARLAGAYAWRSLIDSGSIIAGGTDAPVERGDPLIEFYAAVARKDLKGFSGPDWHPEQAVSRVEALKMFTIWPAYASFAETELGTIEVGKLADLTAFSVDLMTAPEEEIPAGRAVLTIVDGRVVYTTLGG